LPRGASPFTVGFTRFTFSFSRVVQWAYLFERFPSFTQTFCYREVGEIERQGLAPWIFSIRRPRDEPAQDFPAGLAARVRYLPEESELSDEFRWLKRCDRVPEGLLDAERRLKGGRDKARVQEAGLLGPQMTTMGIGHVHTHFAGIAARTAYWLKAHYRIDYSFTAHANDIFCPPDPELSLTLDELVRAAKFIVTVSDFSAARLREQFPQAAGKIYRVYNGIDCEAFPAADPASSGPLIVSVGRYIEKKGFPDLIAACALLRDRGVSFECKLVGEGPMQEELAAAIAQANLGAQVELTGPKSMREVAELLRRARAFALPCVEEADGGMDNLPTVIAEAMASGLPVVSTTLAGVPEMVIHGQTGLLVPPHSPAPLADALARLLADPVTAAQFGRQGNARAHQLFALPVTGRALNRLILEQTAVEPPRGLWRKDPALWWALRQRKSSAGHLI
jgi:colanic acid/amylovoran biosynthesis glycosyltransferase